MTVPALGVAGEFRLLWKYNYPIFGLVKSLGLSRDGFRDLAKLEKQAHAICASCKLAGGKILRFQPAAKFFWPASYGHIVDWPGSISVPPFVKDIQLACRSGLLDAAVQDLSIFY